MIQDWLRKIPDANGVICGGGSPCQGLSRLSADRTHLEDPRSALFFEAVRVMDLVKEVADAEGMWNIRFLENVVPDEEDIRTMSWGPVHETPFGGFPAFVQGTPASAFLGVGAAGES